MENTSTNDREGLAPEMLTAEQQRGLPAIASVSQRLGASLRSWPLWTAIVLGLSVGLGGLSYLSLLQQPKTPNCQSVFWPFASASFRLYCAQQQARQHTLEDLFAAIALIDGLSRHHPLRPVINQLVELWSTQALDLAEAEFHRGNLKRAITFAHKIPARTTAHRLVEARISRWQKIWTQGKAIYQKAEATLEAENWRRAFSIMIGLLAVDNRYWSQTQYEDLNQRILQAQQDETILVKAKRLLAAGGLDNLLEALKLLQKLGADSVFDQSATKTTAKIGRQLIQIAETALQKQDLATALDALEAIPQGVSFREEVEDWITIANASSLTWEGTLLGWEEAIAQVRQLSPQRPLYTKAQLIAQEWEAEIMNARVFQEAQQQAQQGTPEALAAAISRAELIPSTSMQWRTVQDEVKSWRDEFYRFQDQPILNRADELSLQGGMAGLQAAIQQVQHIQPGHPLYAEAQQRVKDWQAQLQQMQENARATAPSISAENDAQAQQLLREARQTAKADTPQALASAMEIAHQIARSSSLRLDAELDIQDWGDRLLELARSQSVSDVRAAIAIARQIPSFSPAYESAQLEMEIWQGQNAKNRLRNESPFTLP